MTLANLSLFTTSSPPSDRPSNVLSSSASTIRVGISGMSSTFAARLPMKCCMLCRSGVVDELMMDMDVEERLPWMRSGVGGTEEPRTDGSRYCEPETTEADSWSPNSLPSVVEGGYGCKILIATASLLDRAGVCPVTKLMARSLEAQAMRMKERSESSVMMTT